MLWHISRALPSLSSLVVKEAPLAGVGSSGVAAVAGLRRLRVLGLIAAEAVMVGGYFVAEWIPLGYGLQAATLSLLGNAMQALSGVVIGLLLIPLLKRIKL